MLASLALQAEKKPVRKPRRRVPDRAKEALKNWRVILDKLYSVVLWGRLRTAVSDWMGPAPLPQTSSQTWATSSGEVALAPTNKGKLYREYLNGNPKKLAKIKGIPAKEADVCDHEARFLKGGGNGHQNWIHCSQCLERWLLSPRTAAIATGRALEEVPKAKAQMRTTRPAAETMQKDRRSDSPKRSQGSMENSDWQMLSESDYLKAMAEQQEKMDQMQAQIDLLTGKAMEFKMAEDACASLEMAASSMDERMHATTQQLVGEFRRLQQLESETRFKSNHFPTKDTREEWVQAAQNFKKGAEQILAFYQDTLNQRSQLAARLTRMGWLARSAPGLADFVVLKSARGLVRRDRCDFTALGELYSSEIFLVVNEPELYLHGTLDDGLEVNLSQYHPDFCQWLAELEKEPGKQAEPLCFLGAGRPEGDDWERWRSMPEAVLHMKLPKEPRQVDHVCRLARAQWKRGGAFVIEVPDQPVRRDAWKRLRSQVQGSSASQRLFRKRRLVSNVADQVRYQAADVGDLEVFYRAPVEQDPEPDFENTVAETYAIDLDNLEEIERGEEEAEAPEDQAGEEAVSSPPVREPTKQEKEAVEKLHRNLGHPSNSSLARTLKVSGAEEHIWRYAKTVFRCPACSSGVLPKPARPATIPKSFAPNVVVAIDLFEFPTWNGEGTDRYLNAICLGTNFQLVEKVRSKQPGAIWAALARGWARILGFPQIILLDQGTEFLGEFRQNAHDMGVLVHCIGARAPYQNGCCERHGALFKTMLQKALWSCPPTSSEDLKMLLREVESAKNRLSDRSGFSPAQRMLGETPRTTGELLADEMVDVVLKGVSGEMEKRLQAKRAAQKAFAEVNTSQAVRKAMRARARTQRTFRPGDIIFVWRSWKAQGIKKQAWVGPGVVVLPDGPNAYVNVKGKLWRVANEHLREGTSEEMRGIEAVHQVFDELRERFRRPGRELGVVEDLTQEPRPPMGQQENYEDPVRAEGEARGLPRHRVEDPERPVPVPEVAVPMEEVQEGMEEPPVPEPPVAEVPLPAEDLPRHSSQVTAEEEPEVERISSQPEQELESRVNAGQEAIQLSRQMDGVPYGAVRPMASSRTAPSAPYLAELASDDWFEEVEAKFPEPPRRDQKQAPHRDHWQFLVEEGVVRRHHVRWRSCPFSPWEAPRVPVPLSFLSSERQSVRVFKTGVADSNHDDWKELKPSKRSHGKWKGHTDFYLTREALKEVARDLGKYQQLPQQVQTEYVFHAEAATFAVKKGSDEIAEKDIAPADWPEWRVEDAKEWAKIEASGAVRVLSVEESRRVVQDLTREGKLNRIIDSRYVRRLKPGEQVGEKPTKKSRWCVRGDQDPDAVELNTYSPTVTTQNLQVILQCAASRKMPGSCGDLQAAFMQSAPLFRAGGKLYVRQPRSGLPGLEAEQLVEIVCGVYGLVDGPVHWRQTLKKYIIEELHYRQSKLDPTVFLLNYEGQLEGVIVIEIDDVLAFGYGIHDAALTRLRQKFKFGKFKKLQELADGTTFNGRRIRQTADFQLLVDMEKYVQERLFPMKIERGRRSNPDAEATAEEKQQARAVIGALAWAAKEARPDAAAAASIMASRLPSAKVRDLAELNKAVEAVKANSQLELKYFPISPESLGWGTVTDASWANHADGSSQGATAVIAFDKRLLSGERAQCSLIWWKSGKLRRKVGSTLAAEAQALNKGLGDLLWAKAIYAELLEPAFDLETFRKDVKSRADVVLQKSNGDEVLRESLAVIDAKSLYDNLMREGNQPQDKFTALDVAIAREKIDGLGVQLRWVEHQSMVVDSLTKVNANKDALLKLLSSGTFRLEAEKDLLEDRLTRVLTSFGVCPAPDAKPLDEQAPACLESGQECSTLAERSGLKKFVKSVDESLKDAVENAKEARKRFEKRVCDFRYAEIEDKGQVSARPTMTHESPVAMEPVQPARHDVLHTCLQRISAAEELLSNMRHAEEIIAGVRETLHALCGQSQLKLADTRQVPPDFQPETLDSDSAPPPCPNGPPHPPVKVSATAPISVPTALPLKAQVRMDQVVLEALREDNKRKVNARMAAITRAETATGIPSKAVSTGSVFSLSREPSRPAVVPEMQSWDWAWTPIWPGGRIHLPILNPDSQIRLAWDVAGLAFICYETYALPVYLAFDFQFVGVFFALAAALDAYFILDIFMSYITAIRTPSGSLIAEPKQIAKIYSRRWLFLDVLAGIPWELVNSKVPWDVQSAQLFKMLRLVRVMRLLRFLRVDIFNESVKMYIEIRPTLMFASGILRLLFILCAVTHWAACAWFCIGSRSGVGQTWVTKHLPLDFSVSEGYVYSLYYTLTTMTTVGYGDITPVNLGEICFSLLLLLIATVVFATVMGYLTDMIANVNSERNQQAEKILMLSNYMTWRNIPPHLYKAIRRHLLHLWETNKGYDSYEDQLQDHLTPVLRRELRFHIFGRVLRNAPFLAFLRDFEVCLKELATKVSMRMLSRGDHIIRIGEASDRIFILVRGKVRISLNESLWTNPASEELMDEIWSTYAAKRRGANDANGEVMQAFTGITFLVSVFEAVAAEATPLVLGAMSDPFAGLAKTFSEPETQMRAKQYSAVTEGYQQMWFEQRKQMKRGPPSASGISSTGLTTPQEDQDMAQPEPASGSNESLRPFNPFNIDREVATTLTAAEAGVEANDPQAVQAYLGGAVTTRKDVFDIVRNYHTGVIRSELYNLITQMECVVKNLDDRILRNTTELHWLSSESRTEQKRSCGLQVLLTGWDPTMTPEERHFMVSWMLQQVGFIRTWLERRGYSDLSAEQVFLNVLQVDPATPPSGSQWSTITILTFK
ncbi:Kcnh5, partial [Symbiodinium microadriaticum]